MSIHILGLGSDWNPFCALLRTANPLLRIYSLPRQTSSPVTQTVCDLTGAKSEVSDIVNDAGQTTPIDILLITTKAHHTRIALGPHAKRITESTLSIFLQNGIGAVDSVRDILCTTRVVLGTTTQGVERIQPDQVQWRFNGETLFSPEPPTILSSEESDVLAGARSNCLLPHSRSSIISKAGA